MYRCRNTRYGCEILSTGQTGRNVQEEEKEEAKNMGETIKCKINIHLKAIRLQVWTGLEGSRRLRLLHFMAIST
jgi:hypothetical protein